MFSVHTKTQCQHFDQINLFFEERLEKDPFEVDSLGDECRIKLRFQSHSVWTLALVTEAVHI